MQTPLSIVSLTLLLIPNSKHGRHVAISPTHTVTGAHMSSGVKKARKIYLQYKLCKIMVFSCIGRYAKSNFCIQQSPCPGNIFAHNNYPKILEGKLHLSNSWFDLIGIKSASIFLDYLADRQKTGSREIPLFFSNSPTWYVMYEITDSSIHIHSLKITPNCWIRANFLTGQSPGCIRCIKHFKCQIFHGNSVCATTPCVTFYFTYSDTYMEQPHSYCTTELNSSAPVHRVS